MPYGAQGMEMTLEHAGVAVEFTVSGHKYLASNIDGANTKQIETILQASNGSIIQVRGESSVSES